MVDDFERRYKLLQGRDPRFDGHFIVGVTSTGIYCRPSCPARVPHRRNVRFFTSAAAAQESGLRACKRCDPDAAPGSPHWNRRADVAGRAFRLIADGVVDRDGVAGLAARLNFSERQLHRILVAEVGASPVALARAKRAQVARTLIESTELPFIEVATAAGFGSVRQFNDTVRAVYDRSPSELRTRRQRRGGAVAPGTIELKLALREPFDAAHLFEFLAARAIPGVEAVDGDTYRRSLALEHGGALIALTPQASHVRCSLQLDDLRDLTSAVARCRRLCDLDADPDAIVAVLGRDRVLGQRVRERPGLRVPGTVDGFEKAVRAVLGQQITVQAARGLAGRLAQHYGVALEVPRDGITHYFPTAAALAASDLGAMRMPGARKAALSALAASVAGGDLRLDSGVDQRAAAEVLLALPGVGQWTADCVAMFALGDPDVFLAGDIGVRRGLEALGQDGDPRAAALLSERWRPWRSYATMHLWAAAVDKTTDTA